MGKKKHSKSEPEDAMKVDTLEDATPTPRVEVKQKKSKKRVLEATTAINDEGSSEEPPRKKKKSKKDKDGHGA